MRPKKYQFPAEDERLPTTTPTMHAVARSARAHAAAPPVRLAHRAPFSSSASVPSHVGSQPIVCPPSVTLAQLPPTSSGGSVSPAASSSRLRIGGSKGELFVEIKSFVHLAYSPLPAAPSSSASPPTGPPAQQLVLSVLDATVKQQRATWGLTRSLVANAIVGVSEGYKLSLRLVGVGYRATLEDVPSGPGGAGGAGGARTQRLNLKLGYAHPVIVNLPPDVKATTPSTTNIVLEGIDKQRLGEVAARIRRWRVPEPYNVRIPNSPTLYFAHAVISAGQGNLCRGRGRQAQGSEEEIGATQLNLEPTSEPDRSTAQHEALR